ncbi:hypothetical protein ACTFIU_002028 [Dictyostelium citrinum]
MKIGGTRFKFLSKLPDAPPSPSGSNTTSPTCSPNTSTSSLPISPKTTTPNNSNNENSRPISSKSSINLVYSDNHPTLNREISSLMDQSVVSPPSSSSSSSASSSTVSSPTNSSIKIIASQSKSSSSLLKKQKWESDTPEDIYQLLAEQKLTEQMIWCGHPDLFPIIHQYSEILNAKENPNGSNILSINLPISNGEFGDVKKKSYKIAKKLTVAQTINLICKKQNVKEPRKYWLSTLYGCILNDEMLLSSYGFGTFFDSWELSLVLKQVFTDKIQTDIPLDSYGEFVVDFLLPPLKQFGGLKKKRIKVDSNLSISQILKQICTKYKIEGSERFSIITTEEFPLILNENSTLGHYGLGNKFQTLELSIVFTELIPPYSLKNNNVPTFGAFQVGSVDPVQSKAVIIDLENKLQDHLKLGEEMVLQIKNLASDLKDKEREIKDKEAQHFTIMNHIEEKLTKIRQNVTTEREIHIKQIADMKLEKESLQDSIKQLKQQLEDLNSLLYQERAINTEATIANNFKISTLEQDIQQLKDQNNDLSSTLKDTETELDFIRIQKQDEYQQQEKEKFDLIQKYELIIKNLQRENEEKIKSILEKHQEEYNQQEKEQQEITNRLFNNLDDNNSNNNNNETNKLNEIISNSSNSFDIGISSIEREQLLSSIQRLTRDINDRDVVIKQVYPKKIQNLESNIKKLEEKLKESETINQQSKQTIALKSLEINELNRQIYSLSKNNSDIQSVLDHTNDLLKKEETKSRNLSQDLSNLKNQCDSQLLVIEQKSQTIQQMDTARIELEAKFKERETYLLLEIEELKKPKPPPLPTYKVNTPKSPDTTKHGDITDVKKLLKPVPNLPPPPREHTIATVADLLFVSMQKRFQSIQGPDIEDLDDDEDSGGEFI